MTTGRQQTGYHSQNCQQQTRTNLIHEEAGNEEFKELPLLKVGGKAR